MANDLLIKGGTIVDGSGAPPFQGDVALSNGRIVDIGRINGSAGRVIDACGLTVSPGFIDPHTHYDAQISWDPLLSCSSWNGVTTVIMGNCGVGIAPTRIADREIVTWDLVNVEAIPYSVLSAGVNWEWESYPEYMKAAENRGSGLNLAFLAPLTPFRHFVMGIEESMSRAANETETQQIAALLEQAMRAGAVGFSVSTVHQIGYKGQPLGCRRADRAELGTYARLLNRLGAGSIEMSLLDVPGVMSQSEFDLLEFIVDQSGRPVTWISMRAREEEPGGWRQTLDKVTSLAKRGAYGQVNCRPSSTLLELKDPYLIRISQFKCWERVLDQPLDIQKQLLRDPGFRQEFREELKKPHVFHGNWPRVVVRNAEKPALKSLVGKSVAEIAAGRGVDPLDCFLDLALEDDLNLQYSLVRATPETGELINDPRIMLGLSDGGAHLTLLCDAGYCTYLLGYWVREHQAITLPRAIQRITSEPARFFGLKDRGLLAAGYAADLTIFDAATVGAKPHEYRNDLPGGGRRLVQDATGIEYTIVNGEPLFEHGSHTGALPGRVLRSGN